MARVMTADHERTMRTHLTRMRVSDDQMAHIMNKIRRDVWEGNRFTTSGLALEQHLNPSAVEPGLFGVTH